MWEEPGREVFGGNGTSNISRIQPGYLSMSGSISPGGEKRIHHMSMLFSRAVEGFILSCNARGLSDNTIDSYKRALSKYLAFHPDKKVDQYRSNDIETFLAAQQVSNKSRKNYFIALSSFWTWALQEQICGQHILRGLHPPRAEVHAIEPFSQGEIRDVLAAVNRSRSYRSPAGVPRDHALRHSIRNRAIILLLLDTGIRASELCGLSMENVNIKKSLVTVFGKGSKERTVPISSRTGQALWRYVSAREQLRNPDPLFITTNGDRLDRRHLAHVLKQIGMRAGIDNVHPHRFRHTFAITYLRNGGDIYTLQAILGHSTLEMVRTYLMLASVDIEDAHRRASPVENWRL
jgi:site-specific recombinase XerD